MKQKNKYMIRKAAPPPLLTSNGNFQILPNPTAEPDAASMNPNFELNEPLFILYTFKFLKSTGTTLETPCSGIVIP